MVRCSSFPIHMLSRQSQCLLPHRIFLYAVCCTVALLPQQLLEFRYFILPYLLFRVHIPQGVWPSLVAELLLYVAVNGATVWLFLYRPFHWPDSDSEQRFMWQQLLAQFLYQSFCRYVSANIVVTNLKRVSWCQVQLTQLAAQSECHTRSRLPRDVCTSMLSLLLGPVFIWINCLLLHCFRLHINVLHTISIQIIILGQYVSHEPNY